MTRRYATGYAELPDTNDVRTLAALVEMRALATPGRRAFAFVEGESVLTVSYREFERYARSFALELASETRPGDRVLLMYPPGPAYVIALFACALAGVIALPLYPPLAHRTLDRLQAVVRDAGAALALMDRTSADRIAADKKGSLPGVRVRAIEALGASDGELRRPICSDDIALLQYTSGSTGTPKGVIITHDNILRNVAMLADAFALTPDDVGVSWVPPYHDMGLIGAIIAPLVVGYPSVLVPPLAFMRRPLTWLKAVSRFRATFSGAPNFAYALCVAKLAPEHAADLDLSAWRIAVNGGEPVRQTTLDDFARAFAPYGFRETSFRPCYGLAEATLLVSGLPVADVPATVSPSDNAGAVVVGCGTPPPAVRVVVADPETRVPLGEDSIGEIWVASPSNARGYWGRSDDDTFRAVLANGDGPYLRTGDMGFLRQGQVFVTGRCKELIIVDGRNLYPRDLEEVACSAHSALVPDGSVVFSGVVEGREVVVFATELRSDDAELQRDAGAAVRAALSREIGVTVHDVRFLRPGAIPRTSSGKLRRLAMRDDYFRERLER